jgi:hypothetical protein
LTERAQAAEGNQGGTVSLRAIANLLRDKTVSGLDFKDFPADRSGHPGAVADATWSASASRLFLLTVAQAEASGLRSLTGQVRQLHRSVVRARGIRDQHLAAVSSQLDSEDREIQAIRAGDSTQVQAPSGSGAPDTRLSAYQLRGLLDQFDRAARRVKVQARGLDQLAGELRDYLLIASASEAALELDPQARETHSPGQLDVVQELFGFRDSVKDLDERLSELK